MKRNLVILTCLLAMLISPPLSAQTLNVYAFGPSGGPGGEPFDHLPDIPKASPQVGQIAVKAGAWLDGINIGYVLPGGIWYHPGWAGGTGGSSYTFDLQRGDHIVAVSGTYGQYVNQIRFDTALGHRSPLYGATEGPVPYRYTAPPGCRIVGMHGRAGKFVDSVGVYLECVGRSALRTAPGARTLAR